MFEVPGQGRVYDGTQAGGLGEEFSAHGAATFGPLAVLLLGQDRADESDGGGAVGEDADHDRTVAAAGLGLVTAEPAPLGGL